MQTVAIYSCYTLQLLPPLSSSHELLPVLWRIMHHKMWSMTRQMQHFLKLCLTFILLWVLTFYGMVY